MTSAAVILLSGGLDSAMNLALAAKNKTARLALTFHYGQRAARQELKAAQALSHYYKVPWKELDCTWLGKLGTSALTKKARKLPQIKLIDLNNKTKTNASMQAVWVPNRNAIFLSIAAAYAESLKCNTVLAGFNKEEASTFPDNSIAFMKTISNAFTFSTQNKVHVDSFTKHWNKTEIIKHALQIKLPLELVWSCYEGSDKRCWHCESCKRTERALQAQGKTGLKVLEKLEQNQCNFI